MKKLLTYLALWLLTSSTYSTWAGSADYTVVPSRSVLRVTGTFGGAPLEPQAPGSDSTRYSQEFNASFDGGALTLETSHVVSLPQKAPLLPVLENGEEGLSYGLKAQLPALGEVFVSTTRLSFYFSTEYDPPLDVSDGTFSPGDIGFYLYGDSLYYAAAGMKPQYVDLHGYGAPNRASSPGSLVRKGNRETLTVPVATTFTVSTPHGDLTLSLSGEIVATRILPAAILRSQTPNDLFGLSVATDTGTIMVGAPFADQTKGEVHIYYQVSDGFDQWQEHQILKPTHQLPVTMFGTAISLDSNTAAIATYHSPVFIFERDQSGLNWRQTAVIETPDDTSMQGDNISLAGNLLAIGVNTFGDSEQGCVLIYRRDDASRAWTLVTRLQPDDPEERAFFGSSVALLGDYLVAGAPGVGGNSGAVYGFIRENDTWRQIQKILPPSPIAGGEFGNSVATNLGQIVIAEPGDGYTTYSTGRVYLYEVQELAQPYHWVLKQELIPAAPLQERSRFGHRVTIDGNNRDIIVTQLKVASTAETQDPGSAYVFTLSRDGWTQRSLAAPTVDDPPSSFGVSVANATLRTVIGDYGSVTRPGAVYIYDLTQPPIPPVFVDAPEDLQVAAQAGESAEVNLEVSVADEDGSDLNVRWFIDGIEEYRHFVDGGVPFTEGESSVVHTLLPGVHQIRVVADERDGDEEAEHAFTVTVGPEHIEGPVIHSITATPSEIGTHGGRLVLVRLAVEASDPDGPVTWRITSVRSSGSEGRRLRQSPDWLVAQNKHSVRVRASTGSRDVDRHYIIHVEARDIFGNITTGQTTVRVISKPTKPNSRLRPGSGNRR